MLVVQPLGHNIKCRHAGKYTVCGHPASDSLCLRPRGIVARLQRTLTPFLLP